MVADGIAHNSKKVLAPILWIRGVPQDNQQAARRQLFRPCPPDRLLPQRGP